MASDIAKLFPYRDANGRLMFRGKVGCDDDKLTLFYPYRDATGKMMLRGKGPDGCILLGWPYRDSNGRLMARAKGGPGSVYISGTCTDVAVYNGWNNKKISINISVGSNVLNCEGDPWYINCWCGNPYESIRSSDMQFFGLAPSCQWSNTPGTTQYYENRLDCGVGNEPRYYGISRWDSGVFLHLTKISDYSIKYTLSIYTKIRRFQMYYVTLYQSCIATYTSGVVDNTTPPTAVSWTPDPVDAWSAAHQGRWPTPNSVTWD